MTRFQLRSAFTGRDASGGVRVVVQSNHDPVSFGCPEWARDFPVCEAVVDTDAKGYAALFGWVQLVGTRTPSDEGAFTWETDPLEIYTDLDTPFGFYGHKPTLFDAPARWNRTRPLAWRAESFLCRAPSEPMSRVVLPVAAFSWGFVLDHGHVTLTEPQPLRLSEWCNHLELLHDRHPRWTFLAVPDS